MYGEGTDHVVRNCRVTPIGMESFHREVMMHEVEAGPVYSECAGGWSIWAKLSLKELKVVGRLTRD